MSKDIGFFSACALLAGVMGLVWGYAVSLFHSDAGWIIGGAIFFFILVMLVNLGKEKRPKDTVLTALMNAGKRRRFND